MPIHYHPRNLDGDGWPDIAATRDASNAGRSTRRQGRSNEDNRKPVIELYRPSRNHARRCLQTRQRIAQRSPKSLELHPHHVAIFQSHAVSEAKRVRAEEVNMQDRLAGGETRT
jgi:hypothetical protein